MSCDWFLCPLPWPPFINRLPNHLHSSISTIKKTLVARWLQTSVNSYNTCTCTSDKYSPPCFNCDHKQLLFPTLCPVHVTNMLTNGHMYIVVHKCALYIASSLGPLSQLLMLHAAFNIKSWERGPGDEATLYMCFNLVSRPYLSWGEGSGELCPNPRFSFYGAHWLGHAKLRSDWSVWLHRWLVVKQSWDLIGQHDCVCDLAYTASNGDVTFLW